MASSGDAVRNFVYDVHKSNLTLGYSIVCELEKQKVDSWEKIYKNFPVGNLNEGLEWDALDEKSVDAFSKCCPLLGDRLAAQLAAQASLFVTGENGQQPLKRGYSVRVGSLRDRIDRLYLTPRPSGTPGLPPIPSGKSANPLSRLVALTRSLSSKEKDGSKKDGKKAKLVPFHEAVNLPSFTA